MSFRWEEGGHFLLHWPSLVFAGRIQWSNADLSWQLYEGPLFPYDPSSFFPFTIYFSSSASMEKTLGIDDFLQQQYSILMGTTDDPPLPGMANLCLVAVLQHGRPGRVQAEALAEAKHLRFEPIHITISTFWVAVLIWGGGTCLTGDINIFMLHMLLAWFSYEVLIG